MPDAPGADLHPALTESDNPAEIRQQLQRILASKAFQPASRSSRFLEYVVVATLEGQRDQLKETSIAFAVFDRSSSYDPKADPVVRNAARRLRDRLEQYYLKEGAKDRIRISLPKGGYVPQFLLLPLQVEDATLPNPGPENSALDPHTSKATGYQRGTLYAAGLTVLCIAIAFGFGKWKSNPLIEPPHSEPLTTYQGQTFQPAISPDTKHIAFVREGEVGNYDIYVKALDGEAVRLTTDSAHDLHPAWSPDGTRIAFLRASKESLDIMITHLLDRSERRLTQIRGLYYGHWEPDAVRMLGSPGPAWSPDGRYLAITNAAPSGPGCPLYLVSLENGERRQLTNPPADAHDFYPTFSPDGESIAFARYQSHSSADLYVGPVRGGGARRLTEKYRDIAGLGWTPDGRTIIFSSNQSGSHTLWKIAVSGGEPVFIPTASRDSTDPVVAPKGNWLAYTDSSESVNLWRQRLDVSRNSRPEKLTSLSRQTFGARYSPDGTKIAFVSNRSGDWEIWTSRADGSDPVRVTQLEGPWVGSPHWSPEGQSIAFDSRIDGHSAIFVVGAEGGKPVRIQVNSFEEKIPSWSHDGKWIYFSSNREGQVAIWKAPAGGGSAQRVSDRPGFDTAEAPDGKTL